MDINTVRKKYPPDLLNIKRKQKTYYSKKIKSRKIKYVKTHKVPNFCHNDK